MPNLTLESNIVVPKHGDTHPIGGHALVIYKKIKDGYQFETVVQPGERFQPEKKLLGRSPSYSVYAVNMDANLRLEFRDKFRHQDQVHQFYLTFTVRYSVLSPQRIVELHDSDPLDRLQTEITGVVERTITYIDWNRIESQTEFKDVEREVLRAGDPDALESTTNLERIRGFAEDLGLTVKSITLNRRLLEDDTKGARAQRDAEQDIEKIDAEHTAEELKQQREQQRERNKRIAEAQTKAQEKQYDIVLDAMNQAKGDVASVKDFANFVEGMGKVSNSRLMPGTSGTTGTEKLPQLTSGETANSFSGQSNGISELINEVFDDVDKIECLPADKRDLLSCALHLLGELLLYDEADREIVNRYGGQILKSLDRLELSREDYPVLNQLLDYEQIKERLRLVI